MGPPGAWLADGYISQYVGDGWVRRPDVRTRRIREHAPHKHRYGRSMTIVAVEVRDLRDGLSRHLAAVREGTEITVTNRGTPVARITPFGSETGLEALLREGIARVPSARRCPVRTLSSVESGEAG